MANPGNRHCANCIGTLSFPMSRFCQLTVNVVCSSARHRPHADEAALSYTYRTWRGLHTGERMNRSKSNMELGHSVTGSMGHLGHLSRPGQRVTILTRCEAD